MANNYGMLTVLGLKKPPQEDSDEVDTKINVHTLYKHRWVWYHLILCIQLILSNILLIGIILILAIKLSRKHMPGQNFINGPPNPRGKEEYTLDGKIPIKHQTESYIMKVTGLKFLVENPKAPFVWFAIGISIIFYIEGF